MLWLVYGVLGVLGYFAVIVIGLAIMFCTTRSGRQGWRAAREMSKHRKEMRRISLESV